ncbi:protein of unknown function DUF134 [Thermosinus carboxydivorans Nor1]|uniref:UPF0251 protein TcarDRAFT_2279 n=1 Tax=Thermosinus carboxydivorans Nor1 TaxID=401526 RepID=A1HNH0_9FIRM|nr:DUF134 domain-containing protein [Thermosinus carboxydivorans]EAX48329.1 protein of unknown function DUF134 [Thermosinus carboxydivorans Nor1]
MGRPHKERLVEQLPPVTHYKPAGIPLRNIAEEMTISVEEMEAMRLADIEQLDQSAAAARMDISPATFNRLLSSAHQKIATALWQGYALRIEGGNFRIVGSQPSPTFVCHACGHHWAAPRGHGHCGRRATCPACLSPNVSRQH